MDREALYRDISALLKNGWLRSRLLMFRGDEERDRIAGWLCREEQAGTRAREDDIRSIIDSCSQCAGIEEKKFGIGTGTNRIMVILNAPQLVNMLERKVLKKESVDMLKKMLQAAGISFQDCYVTNLVKCESRTTVRQSSEKLRRIAKEVEVIGAKSRSFRGYHPKGRVKRRRHLLGLYRHPITLIRSGPGLWGRSTEIVMAKVGAQPA